MDCPVDLAWFQRTLPPKSFSSLERGSQLLGYAADSQYKQRELSALQSTGRWLDEFIPKEVADLQSLYLRVSWG